MKRKNSQNSERHAKRKRAARLLWSTTDRLQLLAYLNWCVQHYVKFEATAPGYLKNATGKDFSKKHIRRKLYQEWQYYGTVKKFEDVFERGTAAFMPLLGNEQEIFNQNIARISFVKPAHGRSRRSMGPDLTEDELASDDNTDSVQGEGGPGLSTIALPELSDMELELNPTMPHSQKNTVTVISQARLSQLEALLIKQKTYSLTLENRISELERRNHDLDHCIRLASSAQGNHGKEARLRHEIALLKNRLHEHQVLTKNHGDLESDRLGFINTSLRAEYGNLHSNIVDTSANICGLSSDDALPEQRTGFSNLANNWARRIGGRDLGSLLGHCEAAQIPKKVILVSLMAAGIFELVLETVFPAFLAADSPLLDQYRKNIETQCKNNFFFTLSIACCPETDLTRLGGPNALQRLDIISIKSFASYRDVKTGIFSERSDKVSSLILDSLRFFLPLESWDISVRSPHNDLETEIIDDMRNTLHHAFNVKIELMLSVRRLKHLFFTPGTLFDGKKMEVVKPQAGNSALLGREVQICLLPALFAVAETTNETEVEEETSLSATYSKCLPEVTEEDAESLVLVEKAIVFLKIMPTWKKCYEYRKALASKGFNLIDAIA